MPASNIRLDDLKTVHRILLAIVTERGGQLTFKCSTYDMQESAKLLMLDLDRKKSRVIIRSSTGFASVAQVEPESNQWSLPFQQAPLERARFAAVEDAMSRSAPTDEQLAELEEKLAAERAVAADVEKGVSPMRIRVRK